MKTKEEALTLYESGFWKTMDVRAIAEFQLYEDTADNRRYSRFVPGPIESNRGASVNLRTFLLLLDGHADVLALIVVVLSALIAAVVDV